MKEERKKESGWPIEDDELDNVSGGMAAVRGVDISCPKCRNQFKGIDVVQECKKCGCRFDRITGEILN